MIRAISFSLKHCGVLTALLVCLLSPQNLSADARVEQLDALGEKIDSLEIEKQRQRRTGRSLADLEEITQAARDTITALRADLQRNPPAIKTAPETAAKKFYAGLKFIRSADLFDRILIGAGCIAVLSGIILLIVFLKSIASPKPKPPAVRYEAKKAISEYGKAGRPVPELISPDPLITPSVATTSPVSSPTRPQAVSAGDVTARIIAEARAGIDVKEIARKHHISAISTALS